MKNLEPFKPTANESKSLLSIEDKYLLKHYLIPDLHAFKSLYFTIRTWAIRKFSFFPYNVCKSEIGVNWKGRGIYGSIYGYLGGYGWLILVAYICQLHPQFAFSPIDLLFEFFRKFSQWNWKSPVNLLTGNQIPKCNTSPHVRTFVHPIWDTLPVPFINYGTRIKWFYLWSPARQSIQWEPWIKIPSRGSLMSLREGGVCLKRRRRSQHLPLKN